MASRVRVLGSEEGVPLRAEVGYLPGAWLPEVGQGWATDGHRTQLGLVLPPWPWKEWGGLAGGEVGA